MKLLYDENLSPRLLRLHEDLHGGSEHVRDARLASASDEEVWRYARRRGLAILSKDSDFHQRSLLQGHPPKVIWVRIGNCSTDEIAQLLRRRSDEVAGFSRNPDASFLVLT